MYHCEFIHSVIGGHLGHFCFVAVVNRTTGFVCSSFENIPEVRLLGHM